jgi:hypothetical protein
MNLEDSFFNMASEVRKKNLGLHNDIPPKAKVFLKVLESSDPNRIILFKDENYDELLKIKRLMSEQIEPTVRS